MKKPTWHVGHPGPKHIKKRIFEDIFERLVRCQHNSNKMSFIHLRPLASVSAWMRSMSWPYHAQLPWVSPTHSWLTPPKIDGLCPQHQRVAQVVGEGSNPPCKTFPCKTFPSHRQNSAQCTDSVEALHAWQGIHSHTELWPSEDSGCNKIKREEIHFEKLLNVNVM